MASRSTKPLLLRRPTKNRTTQSNNNPRLSKNSKDSKNSTNSTNKSTTRNGTRSDKNKQGRGIGKHGGHSKGKHSNGKASADAKKKKLARTRSKNRSHDKSSKDKSSKQSKHRRHQKHVKGKRIGDILGKQADDQVDVERVRMFYDWSPLRLLCYDISESNWFSVSILTIILMNTILIALQTVNDLAIDLGYYFSFVDSLFLGIYIFEIVIKVYVWRSSFVRNGWNNFDLFVVIMSLIEVLLLIVFGQLAGFDPKIFRLLRVFRAVRAFRALRVLRTITFFQNLQIIVSTLIQSIPAMASISLLIFLILYIFGIIGVTLYKDIYPERFGNIWLALFALFQLITLDNWFELYDDVRERDPYMIFYLIVFIIIETFIFINLFIAVIVSYLDHLQERNKLRIKRNLKKKKLALQRRQAQHELMNKKDKTTEAEDARQEIEMAGGIGINALSNKDALGMGTSFRDMEYTKQYYDETVPDPRQRYAINETLMLLASLEDSMHFYSGQQKLMDDLVDIVEKKN